MTLAFAPSNTTLGFAPRAASSAVVPRLRLTRRGRAVVTTLIVAPLVIAAGFAFSGGSAVATADAPGAAFEYVTISSGETLWQLAGTIAPEADPRDVISDIVQLNNLAGADIQPGQRLAIPAAYAG